MRLIATIFCASWIFCGAAAAKSYQTLGDCAGFPRVALQTPPGLCVGLVAQHLGFARGVVAQGHDIYVLDMGGWRHNRGRLLRLGHDGHDAPKTLLSGLDEPSGLQAAPGGGLYLGLMGRLVRVARPGPGAAMQDVVTGLPNTGRHPLNAFAVAPDGAVFLNIGSGTDHCENTDGSAPNPATPCRELAATPPRASIVRVMPGPDPVMWQDTKLVATGLRNSMAQAVMPGGTLVAAVNARDAINMADPALADAALPHDTFDVIQPGADYGWPYCFDNGRPSPEYRRHDCSTARQPTLLLPPHAAPLGMLLYHGMALPDLSGKIVLPYHGYRAAGHRIVALAVDEAGHPTAAPTPLVWDWEGGSPVAVAETDAGNVLITEDHNGTLLQLARQH